MIFSSIPSIRRQPTSEPVVVLQVEQLYVTMGVYLGYALAQYCEFYPIDHVMILGRVSKGAGGQELICQELICQEILGDICRV